MAEAANLLMAYLALEFVSLTSYILTGFLRHNRRSQEAALKYLIYGGVASGTMVYGMSWIFGITGSLDFGAINSALSAPGHLPVLTVFIALVLILAGLGYKIASVPFHMWAPDVYTGAPIPITTFLAVGSKAAGFALLTRFFYPAISRLGAGGNWQPLNGVDWPQLLLVVCVITMTLGNLAALQQTNMKRLLAYSSIAQAGYALMGIVILTNDGIRAMLFYLFAYYVMDAGAFLVVMIVANATGREDIEAYRGLAWRGGAVPAIALAIFLLSLTGIPATIGFIGKFYIFAAVIRSQVLRAGGDRHFEFDGLALLLHGADQDDVSRRAARRRDADYVRAVELRPDGRAGVRDDRAGIVLDADHRVRRPLDALLHRPVVEVQGLLSLAWLHLALNLLPVFFHQAFKVVVRLEVDPELGTGGEVAAQPQRRISTDAALAFDNRVEPIAWHTQGQRQRVYGHSQRLQKLLVQNLTGMSQRNLPFVSRHRVVLPRYSDW